MWRGVGLGEGVTPAIPPTIPVVLVCCVLLQSLVIVCYLQLQSPAVAASRDSFGVACCAYLQSLVVVSYL